MYLCIWYPLIVPSRFPTLSIYLFSDYMFIIISLKLMISPIIRRTAAVGGEHGARSKVQDLSLLVSIIMLCKQQPAYTRLNQNEH